MAILVSRAMAWRQLGLLATAEALAMSLWFSASAIAPQLASDLGLDHTSEVWLTLSMQMGFVAGALLSALLNVSDRFDNRHVIAISMLLGALFNAGIALPGVSVEQVLLLRFLTGVALSGVYPPGIKVAIAWFDSNRGLAIGVLVGALTIGNALPHMITAGWLLGEGISTPWRETLLSTSMLAMLAGLMVVLLVRSGPMASATAPFNWRYALQTFIDKPTRYANYGYIGHMWELYAMWTWVPSALIYSYQRVGWSVSAAYLAGFFSIAVGFAGCVIAGLIADRWGRIKVTVASLLISGSCALLAGVFIQSPAIFTLVCLIWGVAVVADSAQFSAAISELADPRYVGTALTIQTCIGFLATMVSIPLFVILLESVSWFAAFIMLALGPLFGILSLWRLSTLRPRVYA